MRVLSWFVRLVLFLLLVGLALNNLEPATLHLLFGAQWRAPMIVIVLVVFALGAALGVVAMLPSWMRHRRAGRDTAAPIEPAPAAAKSPPPPAERPAAVADGNLDGV